MKSFNISAFLALIIAVIAFVSANSHELLWKNEVTDVHLLRRLQNTDFTTHLSKRAATTLDAKSNSLSNNVGNTLWNIVSNL